jgi:hypothetical protein
MLQRRSWVAASSYHSRTSYQLEWKLLRLSFFNTITKVILSSLLLCRNQFPTMSRPLPITVEATRKKAAELRTVIGSGLNINQFRLYRTAIMPLSQPTSCHLVRPLISRVLPNRNTKEY